MDRQSRVIEQVCNGQCTVVWKVEGSDTRFCTLAFGHEGNHSWQADYDKVNQVNHVACGAVAATDPVTPTYYQGDYVMRIIEDFKLDFLRGTMVKYLLRAGNKTADTELVDLEKARWYLDRKIQQLKKETKP